MKIALPLAVTVWTASAVGCMSTDNLVGSVPGEHGGTSGVGGGGGRFGNAPGGTTSNGAPSGGSIGATGGSASGGTTTHGGATGAGGASTVIGGIGGTRGGTGTTGGAGRTIGGARTMAGGTTGGGASGTSGGTGGIGGSAIGSGGSAAGLGGSAIDSGGSGNSRSSTGGTGGTLDGAAGETGNGAGFACLASPATCSLIHNWTFSTTSQWQGTYTYQLSGLLGDKTTDPTVFHVTGMVDDYAGFGIYAGKCTSLQSFVGITFTLKGTIASEGMPNSLTFFVLTNADEPIDTFDMSGACPGVAGIDCVSPHKVITTSNRPQTIMFNELGGGKPVATLEANEVLGLRWQIDPYTSPDPFAIDLSLSYVMLVGSDPAVDCSTVSSGGAALGSTNAGSGSGG